MPSNVALVPAAAPEEALAHFERRLRVETDCWDTHHALTEQEQGFVLLDVRSPDLYAAGHIPKAINLPHGKIIARKMRDYPDDTLFVVYCAGPHCNGANKAAIHLAKLGYQVKELIGGIEGWKDEGFDLVTGAI